MEKENNYCCTKVFYDITEGESWKRGESFVRYHWFRVVLWGQIFPLFPQKLWDLPATQEVCVRLLRSKNADKCQKQTGAALAFSQDSLGQNFSSSVSESFSQMRVGTRYCLSQAKELGDFVRPNY